MRIRTGACIAFCLFLVVVMTALRLERDARRYLERGDDYLQREQAAEALFCWKVAVLCYVPFSPTTPGAADRLEAAGERAIRRGDAGEAERAFRYLRSALLAARHLWQPMPDRVRRVEERLAAMAAPAERERIAGELRVRHGTSALGLPFLAAGMLGWPWSFRVLLRSREHGGASTRNRAIGLMAAAFACLVIGTVLS